MSPRVTAVLFAIAVALGAFVFVYELREESAGGASGSDELRVFVDPAGSPLEPDQVESLSFTSEEGIAARVERREGRWRVVEPVDAPADQQEVEGMISTLVNLSSEGVIEEPQKASVYGLEDQTRALRFRAGGADYELRVGSKTPVGPNSYVAPTSSDRVFIVSTWKVNSLTHSLLEIRDRRVVAFDPNAVERLTLRWPRGGVTVERNRATGDDDLKGKWKVVEPAVWRADDSEIDTLLSDLAFLRAESFVDEQLGDAETGLDEPAFEASLVFDPAAAGLDADAEEGAAAVDFALGGWVDSSGRIARGRSGSLFRVSEDLLAELPRRVVDYRYKQLSSFESADAHVIELTFHPPGPGGAITVRMVRTDEGWTATSDEALAAGVAARLVTELARLKARDIVAESMGQRELAAMGLLPAHVIFRVFGEPGEDAEPRLQSEIHLGDGGPSQGILAQAGGRDTVYRLDFALAEDMPLNYGEFVQNFASKTERDAEGGPEEEAADAVVP